MNNYYMLAFNNTLTEIIKKRRSVRSFDSRPIPDEQLIVINKILDTYKKGVFGNSVKFHFVEKDLVEKNKVKLGTYGFISGAKYFIIGEVENKPKAFEDFGYLFEKVILHLTDLGLGTCWLGGTFSRSAFALAGNTEKGMLIPCVTPVGYAAEKQSIKERLIRYGAKSNHRKAFGGIFFDNDVNSPLNENKAGGFYNALEMVRLAPSASNRQPWRIIKTNNGFDFYLKRTSGYNTLFKEIDLQKVDMGIAMAHFELGCKETNYKGDWVVCSNHKKIDFLEYIVSWA